MPIKEYLWHEINGYTSKVVNEAVNFQSYDRTIANKYPETIQENNLTKTKNITFKLLSYVLLFHIRQKVTT